MNKQRTDQEITINNPCKSALITCHEQSRMGESVFQKPHFYAKNKILPNEPIDIHQLCQFQNYSLFIMNCLIKNEPIFQTQKPHYFIKNNEIALFENKKLPNEPICYPACAKYASSHLQAQEHWNGLLFDTRGNYTYIN